MVYGKLPGVYFTETVSTISTPSNKAPLFIVENSKALATVDNQLISYNNLEAFKAVFTDASYKDIVDFIEATLTEAGQQNSKFYVYKNTTGTAASFTKILVDSSNVEEIEDVIYLEGIAGSGGNTFQAKVGGLQAGANTCYQNGVNRICYTVPAMAVAAAVTGKGENKTNETAVIEAMETLTAGVNSGRIAFVLPDYAGAICGRVIASGYNEEIGYSAFNTDVSTPEYNFSYSEMVQLQDMGVMFVRGERLRGATVYRVNLGVSSAFASDAADGLLICRRVADEVLREVKVACDTFIKAPNDIEEGLQGLQVDIDNVIDRFVTAREVFADGTSLTVEEGNTVYDFQLNGTIKPIKSTIAINVNTKLS
jgi:hypothetical protein